MPASVWRAQTYPPPGPFPHFDDATLQQTMGATEQAHRSLMEKRQQKQDQHDSTLQHYGLMPQYYDLSEPTEEQGTQTEGASSSSGTQTFTPAASGGTQTENASSSSGTQTFTQAPSGGTQTDEAPASHMDTGSQAAIAPWWGPIRRYKPPRTSPMIGTRGLETAEAMETATVNYGSEAGTVDYEPLEIDDQEMRRSTKKMAAEDEEKKKKARAMPPPKPKVKQEGARAVAIPAARAVAPAAAEDDDERDQDVGDDDDTVGAERGP